LQVPDGFDCEGPRLPYTGRDKASAAQCKIDGSDEVTAEAQLKDIRETPSLAGCLKRIKIRACGEENYGDIGLRIPYWSRHFDPI
jgi:hypothetical protein